MKINLGVSGRGSFNSRTNCGVFHSCATAKVPYDMDGMRCLLSQSVARPWLPWLLLCALSATVRSHAQLPFEREPINYATTASDERVAQLQKRLEAGDAELHFDKRHGYLKSLLRELEISPRSQLLVFSKTSLQFRTIFPWSPRAIYFNDETYVGWVPGGDVIELSTIDPQQGAIFYTLRQEKSPEPRFVRDRGNCLSCHATRRTHDVPGHLVRSVYPSPTGLPHFHAGTFRSNHTLPLEKRWGGWYVTGTHGDQRHMGNAIAPNRDRPYDLDREGSANLTDLSRRTRTTAYLTPHSDIVALMVLEHQVDMHNLITRATFDARLAQHDTAVLNQALERPPDYISDSTHRRLQKAGENLLKYLLFSNEAILTDKITGTSDFSERFAKLGRRDRQGRSLREFDLQRRLFKYPCSFLIHSAAFAAIPSRVKNYVYRRLWEVLTGKDRNPAFRHLSSQDRKSILSILRDTHEGLPDYWQKKRGRF